MDVAGIYDGMVSLVQQLGIFDQFPQHEPKSAPGRGVTGALWLQSLGPAPRASGLSQTAGRLEFVIRIYQNMLAEPQDATDPAMLAAADALFTAYSSDFTLGDAVFAIDLLGAWGNPLSGRAGYLNQDSKLYRVFDVVFPLIIDGLYTQEAT